MMLTWFDTLLDYNFDVVHLPGFDNVLPDRLSRFFNPVDKLEGGNATAIQKTAFKTGTSSNKNGPKVFRMRVKSAPTDTMAPPDENRPEELQNAHLATGHAGAEHIVRYLNNRGMHWNNILRDAVEFVKSCMDYQKFNIAQNSYNPLRPICAYIPGDHWAVALATFNKTATSGK
ncbi:hypothetical protein VTP01DRAFT_986 [Rhizomucor pusillus]|uniref:uncharacterized protein n=1 Tax=Rhizomucor pusillus TaxID=4840 RepID=UPI0037435948